MSIKQKIGNFFIKNSNSYNFYKSQYEKHLKNKKIDASVEEQFHDLKNDFNEFKAVANGQIESTNFLFKTIFLDYELNQPKGVLKYIQDLSFELLVFVSNICEKYHIEWWLDYGSLLGAVRHGDFIPWDDNIDIGMTRKEYLKFIKCLSDEINHYNLNNFLKLDYKTYELKNDLINTHAQILIISDENDLVLATLDVLPYDFSKNKISKKNYNNAKVQFLTDSHNSDLDECLKNYYEKYDLTFENSALLISGIENNYENSKPLIFNSDKIFPLEDIEFKYKNFPCPNNTFYYLKALYDNYMVIPVNLRRNSKVDSFRYNKNNETLFADALKLLKDINKNI